MGHDFDEIEERILILAASDNEAGRYEDALLRAGIACHACSDLKELCEQIEHGAGLVLLTSEQVVADHEGCLAEHLRTQPTWSDLPVIVLMRGGSDSPLAPKAFENLGNVVLLESPVGVVTLVSAVGMALRSRRRQYQLRASLAERQRTEQALRDADQRKDEFLAMLAHELRNPLAPIRSALELLRMDPHGESSEMARDIMGRQIQHLVRLVDDLLDVSRIVRGRIELRKEQVELSDVLRHGIEEARDEITAHRHELIVECSEDLWVMGDPTRLAQIVANLLNNAAKYTEDGGKIWIATSRDAHTAVISVRDTGIGISAETLPTIFDLFTQSARTIERSQGGLGIGLTLVRRLVELHGGAVTAYSAGLGRGSEFIVRLPMMEQTASSHAEPWQPAEVTPRRVLVVDDNRGAATILARMLSQFWKHQVQVAHDGPSALEIARRDRPEVVILDIGLPGLSGYEVVRQLRDGGAFAETLFVSLTGYGQEKDRESSSNAGFDEHLVKPASVVTLEALFRHPKLSPPGD